ncbi:MAG: hypothetical protein RMJ88_15715 [Thermogemmata sp.]|nr:hypothetical protein [Thermogemmata sp.]
MAVLAVPYLGNLGLRQHPNSPTGLVLVWLLEAWGELQVVP